jgi:NAD+ dependent glucose-6-phosphate dehydrogenase
MSKVAVTGAAGTIGSHLCEELARDHEIVRIDVAGVDEPVDVQDLGALERAVKGCETIVHLAGIVKVKASWEETRENLEGTYNAFEAARRAKCKRVIFASSNHAVGMYEADLAPGIYRPASGTLLTNTVPLRPDGLYGVWKCFGESVGRYYSDEYGLHVACLRIGAIRKEDTPIQGDVKNEATWLRISDEDKRLRMKAMWMSQRDLVRLVRAIMESDVRFGIVYGVGDNATRFLDLEAGRALYGFWPMDGVK